MVVEILQSDSPEEVERKLREMNEHIRQERVKRLKPFFGILKTEVDPLKFQKEIRDEWE
jgi:hypothetical protein